MVVLAGSAVHRPVPRPAGDAAALAAVPGDAVRPVHLPRPGPWAVARTTVRPERRGRARGVPASRSRRSEVDSWSATSLGVPQPAARGCWWSPSCSACSCTARGTAATCSPSAPTRRRPATPASRPTATRSWPTSSARRWPGWRAGVRTSCRRRTVNADQRRLAGGAVRHHGGGAGRVQPPRRRRLRGGHGPRGGRAAAAASALLIFGGIRTEMEYAVIGVALLLGTIVDELLKRRGGGRGYVPAPSASEGSQQNPSLALGAGTIAYLRSSIPLRLVHHAQQRFAGREAAHVLAEQPPLPVAPPPATGRRRAG